MKNDTKFSHESLQDQNSISEILKSLTQGLSKGKLVLEDDNGSITLEPNNLLRLKISATQEEGLNKLNLKITWQETPKKNKGKPPTLNIK